MNGFSFILPAAAFADAILTYYYVNRTNKPQNELNALARFLWSKFGYGAGSIVMAIISMACVLILSIILPINFSWFMAGVYLVVLILNCANADYLNQTYRFEMVDLPEIVSLPDITFLHRR
jgi:hypothetical protein